MALNKVNIVDVIDQKKIPDISKAITVGVDIGSRQSKAILIYGDSLYTVTPLAA